MQSLRYSLAILLLLPGFGFAAQSTPVDSLNEQFDPTTLRDWKIAPNTIEIVRPIEEELDERVLSGTERAPQPKLEVGYRVQILSTTDYLQALEIDSLARLRWKQNVYMRFDSPYYKIRIGNAVHRDEADRLQQTAVKAGFRTAWVVRTEIERKSD